MSVGYGALKEQGDKNLKNVSLAFESDGAQFLLQENRVSLLYMYALYLLSIVELHKWLVRVTRVRR
jgi:hypothetical protein